MTEVTVFTRRNGGTETRGGERFDGPACVASRLAWPESNGYTNPIRRYQVRVSVRSGHARRFATPVEPQLSSLFVSVSSFLRSLNRSLCTLRYRNAIVVGVANFTIRSVAVSFPLA